MDRNASAFCRVVPLKELCQRALVRNYDKIRYLGTTPQFLIAEALSQCTAEQLENIEVFNPHIIDDNESLWRQLYTKKYGSASSAGEAGSGIMISWRERYREMRLGDEVRAHEIRERVRDKVKEAERERDARKIRITDLKKAGSIVKARAKSSTSTKGMSLVQKARMETRARMQRMGSIPRQTVPVNRTPQQRPTGSIPELAPRAQMANIMPHGTTQRSSPRVSASPVVSPSPKHVKQQLQQQQQKQQQLSPAGSPSYSPAYHSSPSYSPPYLSSSCSPTHSSSAYSPPYVPDPYPPSANPGSYSPKFDIFEAMFGVSVSSVSASLPPTVIFKEGTRPRRTATSKKHRHDETGDSNHHCLRFSPDRQDTSEF